MRKSRQRLRLFELPIIIFTISIAAALGLYMWHQQNANDSKSPTYKKLLVTLKNTGSTNFTGWDVTIYSDGSARLSCDSGPQLNKTCTSASYKPNTFPADKLSNDLAKTHLDRQYNCIRTASFGSSETLIYKNKPITGIDCYFLTNSTSSLSKDILPFLKNANLD